MVATIIPNEQCNSSSPFNGSAQTAFNIPLFKITRKSFGFYLE